MDHAPIYSQSMPRDRWLSIMSFLHFSNNEDQTLADDKLRKLRPLLDILHEKFESVYVPDNISIDEELVAWKSRLDVRQFNPAKRARFGVKIRVLCESSGYMSSFTVYAGKDNETNPDDIVGQVGKPELL